MSRALKIPRLEKEDILLENVSRQDELRYRRLVESSPEAILVYSGDRVLFANQAAASLLGIEKSDSLINKKLNEFIHPVFFDLVLGRIEQALCGERLGRIEQQFIRADGTVIDVEVQTGLVNFYGQGAVQVSARDITERKRAEKALQYRFRFEQLITSISTRFISLATEEFESAIKTALEKIGRFVGAEHSYIVLFNEANDQIDNVIEWAESDRHLFSTSFKVGLQKIAPFFLKNLVGRDVLFVGNVARLPYENAFQREFMMNRGIRSIIAVPILMGKALMGSLGLESKQSDMEWTEDTTVLLKVAGEVFSNAIERKRSESALRLSERRFTSAIQVSTNPMAIIRLDDGRFIDINDSCLKILGYSRDELIGTPCAGVLYLNHHERAALIQKLKLNGFTRNTEITLRTRDGRQRLGLISCEIVEIHGEKHLISAFVDLTERIQMEKEMNRLERLNLIGEMAASIGHEIRNPLTSVRGFLQVLSEKQDCHKFTEFFHIMIEELDRANSIITEYLALAKDRNIELKLQNINPIVTNLYPLLMLDASNSGTQVELELNGVPPLRLDEKEIRHLLLNLVRNANEAMIPGGTVTIRTYQDEDEVVLAIEDEGCGIPPQIEDKLGTPFYTTKEQGTGLGLAVCYSIVARHQGRLEFETSSEGTTFFISFKVPG